MINWEKWEVCAPRLVRDLLDLADVGYYGQGLGLAVLFCCYDPGNKSDYLIILGSRVVGLQVGSL